MIKLQPGTSLSYVNNDGQVTLFEFYASTLDADVTHIGPDGKVIDPNDPNSPTVFPTAPNFVTIEFYDSGSVKLYESQKADGSHVLLNFADTIDGASSFSFGVTGDYSHGELTFSDIVGADGHEVISHFANGHLTNYQLTSQNLQLVGTYDASSNQSNLSLTNSDHVSPIVDLGRGTIDSLLSQNIASIISQDGAGLISEGGAGLIGQDGAGLIGQDGAGLNLLATASLIGQDGAGIISQDGAGIISQDGAGIFSGGYFFDSQGVLPSAGADIIGNDGASLAASFMASAATGARFFKLSSFSDTPSDDHADPGSLTVGGDATGELEEVGDRDSFAVSLTGGTRYILEVKGADSGSGSLSDPWLRVFDADFNQVGQIDDGGVGLDSKAYFTPSASGTYYLEASDRGDAETGTYTVAVTEAPTVSINSIDKVELPTASSHFDLNISGVTTNVEDGRTITVTVLDADSNVIDTLTGGVNGNKWTVILPDAITNTLLDGTYSVTADASDANGNAATEAVQTFVVDEVPTTVSIDKVTGDNIIDASDKSGGFDVTGTSTDLDEDQTVTVGLNGHTYSATVQADGTWSAHVSAADAAALKGYYDVTAQAQNESGASTSADIHIRAGDPTFVFENDDHDLMGLNATDGLHEINQNSFPTGAIALNNLAIYSGNNGRELWVSDGTSAGTHVLKDINTDPDSVLAPFGNDEIYMDPAGIVGNKLFFFAYDGDVEHGFHGRQLWVTDGTAAGTQALTDGPTQFNELYQTTANGRFYFVAGTADTGYELWSSDGTTAGTTPAGDINPGSADAFTTAGGFFTPFNDLGHEFHSNFLGVNGQAFFTADNGVNGFELWKSDGSTTQLVVDLDTYPTGNATGELSFGSFPTSFVDVNGTLLFNATATDQHNYLFKTDGTLAGTYFIGGGDTGFVQPTVVDDRVFFVGNVPGVEGNELFETAPGLSSTLLVRDINPLSDGGAGSLNSNPSDLTAFGHQLLFDADDGTNGRELWISDGTFAGTHMVKDIDAGSGSGVPGGVKPMITWNGLAFFTGYDADSTHGSNGAALWRTDGTEAGTYMLTDGFGGTLGANDGHTLNYMGPALTSDPENLYFQSFDLATNTFDLYKTDGNTFTQVAVTDGAYPPVALFDVPANVNVAPTDITIDDDTIDIDLAFSGFPIGELTAIDTDPADQDPNNLTYKLLDSNGDDYTGTDFTLFHSVGGDYWELKAGSSLSSTTQADNPIKVEVMDSGGNTFTKDFTIHVTGVPAGPSIDVSASPSTGQFKAGQTIVITVNVNEQVDVTGTPTIALNDGGTAMFDRAHSDLATGVLKFNYTVGTGQDTPAGHHLEIAGEPVGGTIQHSGNDIPFALTGTDLGPTVDTTAPVLTVDDVDAPEGGAKAGDEIEILLAVGENVGNVTGDPVLKLSDGGTAIYDPSGAPDSSHVAFKYTVSAGHNTSDLQITSLTGGVIQDMASNNADVSGLAHADLGVIVDTIAPTVTKVAGPAGTYGFGAGIDITVTMKEAVTADTTNGTPTLALSDGGTASYVSGSGTDTLVFHTNVSLGQSAPTGLKVTSISLNGGTIQDDAGNDAVLTGSAVTATMTAVKVDAVLPALDTVTSSLATITSHDSANLTLTFSEKVTAISGTTITLDNGDTAVYKSGSGSTKLVFTYTPGANTASDPDLHVTALGSVEDAAGNPALIGSTDIVFGKSGNVAMVQTPIVVSVGTSSGGHHALKAGDVLGLSLELNEGVTVTGTPGLKLSNGGIAAYNDATSDPDHGIVNFTYTVGPKGDVPNVALSTLVLSATDTIKDAGGNSLALGPFGTNHATGIAIDNKAPTLTAALTHNTGASKTDQLTNDPTISGKTEAGATVTVMDGVTNLGTTTADNTGAWSFTASGLTDGSHSLTAQAQDAAGNTSPASKPITFTLDTTVAHITSFEAVTDGLTNATSVVYDLKFDEAVTGVVASDFALTQNGLTGAKVSGIKAVSGSEYLVTVATGKGDGDLHLDYLPTQAHDTAGNALAGGHFGDANAVASSNVAVVTGDINGDGKIDLVSLSNFSDSAISLGNGDGTFQDQVTFNLGVSTVGGTMADLNGDGRADLIATNQDGNGVVVGLGQAGGALAISGLHQDGTGLPFAVAVGDLNGDGFLDIVEPNQFGNVAVFFNNGDGTFANTNVVGTGNANSIAVGDFDGDGKGDIAFVTTASDNVSVMLGNGAGSFAAPSVVGTGDSPAKVVVGDLNGDGKLDLVTVYNGDGKVEVLLGNGDGTFESPDSSVTGAGASDVVLGDFNQDGHVDVAVANTTNQSVITLFGSGDGTFGSGAFVDAGGAGRLGTGDFNNDGRLDLAIANGSSSVVLLNQPEADGESFTIDKTAPTVTGVSSPTAAATHVGLGGGPIEIDLQLSDDANINGPLTGLTLKLSDGGVATYDAGNSADDKLAFTYTPAAKQNTSDLTVTSLMVAKGTTVTDEAGNALNVKGAANQHLGIVVDTTAPTVGKVTASPTSGAQVDGNTVTFTLAMKEHVNADAGVKLTLSNGGTAALVGGAATDADTLTFSYTVSGGGTTDLKIIGIDQSGGAITDLAGNQVSSTLSFDTRLPVNVFTWKGGDGNFTDANWNPSQHPGLGAAAQLTASGTYTVLIDGSSGTPSSINTLTTAKGATLELNANFGEFDILNGGTNAGTLKIDDNNVFGLGGNVINSGNINSGNGGTAIWSFTSDTTLSGKGHIAINSNSSGAFSTFNGGDFTVTNVDNNITVATPGIGFFGSTHLDLVNQAKGIINAVGATNLQAGNGLTNFGLIEATGGAALQIFSDMDNSGTLLASGTNSSVTLQADITNTKTGIVSASGAGAHVDFSSFTMTGGTLKTASGGLIEVTSHSFTALDGSGAGNPVNIAGTVEIGDTATLSLKGIVNNTGIIQIADGVHGSIFLDDDTTLNGNGKIVLTDNSSNGIGPSSTATLLTNVSNTISGAGSFGNGFMTLINQAKGVINGNGASNELTISAASIDNSGILEGTSSQGLLIFSNVDNSNLIQALGGDARLDLINSTITQTGKGTIQAAGADAAVFLSNETIIGGALKTDRDSAIVVTSQSTLDGTDGHAVTLSGRIFVESGADLQVEGSIVNNGTLTITANSPDLTTLFALDDTTFSGKGTIVFDGWDDKHAGLGLGSHTFDNVSNTISGTGFIESGTLHNGAKGVIGAMDGDAFYVAGVTLNNDGKLEAAGTGHLDLHADTITNGKTGSIFTTSGAEISVDQTDITGGTITIAKNSSFDGEFVTIDHAKIANTGTFTGSGLDITNSTVTNNAGGVFGADGGNVTVNGALTNNGTLNAHNGILEITGAVTGKGDAIIHDGGTLEFDAASSAKVTFEEGFDGILALFTSTTTTSKFTGTISGFDVGDRLLLGGLAYDAGDTWSYVSNAAHTGGTLTVTDIGHQSLALTFLNIGDHVTTDFHLQNVNNHVEIHLELA